MRGFVSRFIPARAGNTPEQRRALIAKAVHPRACGEHDSGKRAIYNQFGSSPRVRGTRRTDAACGPP